MLFAVCQRQQQLMSNFNAFNLIKPEQKSCSAKAAMRQCDNAAKRGPQMPQVVAPVAVTFCGMPLIKALASCNQNKFQTISCCNERENQKPEIMK